MEVLIRDFNCIQSVKMDFQPGFNVIQGPSNSGKSSAIKAIEKCIFNQSGSTNVRQGKDNLLVGIKYNDHEVYLTKGKNTKYKVDNQIFEKIGVNQLEQVADALNIREVVLGGEKVRLNFSNQFAYPFLLDKTPGQLYKFIVDSAESESLSDVLKDMSKDIKDLDKSIVQNEAQMDILNRQKTDLEMKLSNADSVLDVSNQILELDSIYTSINREVELKDRYLSTLSSKKSLEEKLGKIRVGKDDLDNLDKIKDSFIACDNRVNKYKGLVGAVVDLNSRLDSYVNVDVGELDSIYQSYKDTCTLVEKYKKAKEGVSKIEASLVSLESLLEEEKAKLDEFKVCPLCGGDLKC